METSLSNRNRMIDRQVDFGAKPMFYTLAMPQAKKHVDLVENKEVELWFLRARGS